MDTEPIAIDGVAGPVVVTTSTFGGRPVITVAGRSAPKLGKRYLLPAAVGGTVDATLRTRIDDPFPTIEVNGIRYRTGPKLPVVLQCVALLPLALIGVGGALGGVIGTLGVFANLAVARNRIPTVTKALLMIGACAVTAVVYLLLAIAVRGAINHA